MRQPLLLIRADGGPGIGAGHVLRCLALAEAWTEESGGAVRMITAAPPQLLQRVQAESIGVLEPALPAGSAADATRMLELARECGAAGMVADGYAFGAGFQEIVQRAGTPLLSIDDWAHSGPSRASIILDQNLGVEPTVYADRPPTAALLLGPHYALLRQEFRMAPSAVSDPPHRATNILVALGGGDQQAAATVVLESLALLQDPQLAIRVLIGPASTGADAIRSGARMLGLRIECVSGGSDLPSIMGWAHLAISGGGSTCWELAFLGIPSVVIELAANQRRIASALAAAGIVENAGRVSDLSPATLAAILGPLLQSAERRRAQSIRGRSLIDGQGARRVARRIATMAAAGASR